ncbi:50S ribosomal protein L3 [Candidatus Parcubacteria bacterium]|nr:50S ribosomal protein L3 [Candidatus Parcubacteria bacterium]
MKKLVGQKVEMSQVFAEDGQVTPVTLVTYEKEGDGLEPGIGVTVTGVSKGRGFTGVMKRWGFSGGPATHGQSDRARAPGSIGAGTTPGRVHKGKKMPGRHGGQRVTVKGLKIVEIDREKKSLKILGAVPGARGSKVEIKW